MIDAAIIDHVASGRDLSVEAMQGAVRDIMTGGATPAQIGGLLVALRMKGETVAEISAAASVLRELVTPVPVNPALADELVDTCGTGGDGSGLFNVSTASAFVVAAAGGTVAKHGNRSVSSTSGSADVLEAAGIATDLSPEAVARCIDELGAGFMYAPAHHGAMRHAVGPRRELGIRTLLNIVGPLVNPAGARNQVMGVFNGHLCEPLAEVLQRLGSRHVMVVHSGDGIDELSINAPTRVAELKAGQISTYMVAPEDVGLERGSLDGVRAVDAADSLRLIRQALSGVPGRARDLVAFNAGAALYVSGRADNLADGVALACDTMASGDATRRLDDIAQFSRHLTEQAPTTP
ncbi:anthranilate phosphoribosyltransferase [Salinisphaera sp. USBA-960]|uniref:anthranilate phosphoribosyltransferase n=1 Tax=Salinisphaera orenii TaxID=856731 RepID=UPI000DBE1797|nr:anthranilate phosphoribosyltransferase [Salifodinibacter halophilus]NNC25567.1 anthranilate phosphoribosyltransferase [Salifodinibacter halophilus]